VLSIQIGIQIIPSPPPASSKLSVTFALQSKMLDHIHHELIGSIAILSQEFPFCTAVNCLVCTTITMNDVSQIDLLDVPGRTGGAADVRDVFLWTYFFESACGLAVEA